MNYNSIRLLSIIVAVTALLFIYLLIPGVLTKQAEIDARIEENIAQKIEQLRRLQQDESLRGQQQNPPGIFPDAGSDSSEIPRRVIPANPEQIPVLPDVASTPRNYQNLAELINEAVVLILSETGIGTGFLISSSEIVTNHHVIENAQRVIVLNEKIGIVDGVQVIAQSAGSGYGGEPPDIAVLKLAEPADVSSLPLTAFPNELDNVIAAGYPGIVLGTDDAFSRIRNGEWDDTSIPTSNKVPGSVTAIQNRDRSSALVVHSAEISPGNSGGPLLDECGRVVGVNTFIVTGEGPSRSRTVYYAQPGKRIIEFLNQNNIEFRKVEGFCGLSAQSESDAS